MKWDYKMLVVRDQIDPDKMVEELNKAGLEGWEAVGLAPKYGIPALVALLKRPHGGES